jgi:glycosyltransferase involved in cell wall biosynthesis
MALERPIRVAFLLQDFTTGGISQWIYTVCAELQRTDPGRFEFHFICTHGWVIRERFRRIGTPVFLGREGRAPNWLVWRRVRKYLRQLAPDVVQFSNLVQYRDICLDVRPPVIIERKAGMRTVGRYDTKGVDAIICQNRAVMDALKGEVDKLFLVYHGVDIEAMRSGPVDRLGYSAEDFIVGQVSRIGGNQGHALLIDAVREVRRRHDRVKLVLVGGVTPQAGAQELLPELRERARPLGDAVRFTGDQDDPYPFLRGFDVATCTSTRTFTEGAPRKLIEPMALGIPCVTTDSGATDEVVDDGVNGFMVPDGDVGRFAACIERLMLEPLLYRELSTNARRKVEQAFDIRRQAQAVKRIYLELLSEAQVCAAGLQL